MFSTTHQGFLLLCAPPGLLGGTGAQCQLALAFLPMLQALQSNGCCPGSMGARDADQAQDWIATHAEIENKGRDKGLSPETGN